MLPVRRKKSDGVRDFHVLARPHMQDLLALLVLAGTDPHKGDSIAVTGIHIRLDLEYKTGQLVLLGSNVALLALAWLRLRRVVDELVKQLLDAEVRQRRAEEHR